MLSARALLGLLLVAACSGKNEPEPPPPPPLADAGIDGITSIADYDPASGMHLDDMPNGKTPASKRASRQGTPIGILLKSEPTGATVYVDGQNVGTTPKYWSGTADGTEHEFAFAMPRYALARYKFVPITNGTLHATLTRVGGTEMLDAGIEPVIAPKLAPDAAIVPPQVTPPPVPPPPTVRTPDTAPKAVPTDAAPKAAPPDAAVTTVPLDAARKTAPAAIDAGERIPKPDL